MTNSQITSKWQPENSALPNLSKYKILANTIKRHLDFLPNDDFYNIHLKSLIVSPRGETSGVKANYFWHLILVLLAISIFVASDTCNAPASISNKISFVSAIGLLCIINLHSYI